MYVVGLFSSLLMVILVVYCHYLVPEKIFEDPQIPLILIPHYHNRLVLHIYIVFGVIPFETLMSGIPFFTTIFASSLFYPLGFQGRNATLS
jgi:hypothetical protein